ncbi:hypothetical protein B566_EDAN002629 [Ephemera danica]|nr:hypothetical protein B566_EDAN002629 [Ephemera danica]
MEVFPKNHVVPFSKMLTFFRTGPFALRAVYNGEVPHTDPKLGEFIVKDVKPSPTGESQKVKVKVRVNIHGVFKVSSASLVELAKTPAPGEEKEQGSEPMEVEQEQQQQQQQSPKKQENGPKSDEGEGEGMEEAGEKDKKGSKKAKVVCTELPVECKSQGLTPDDLNGCQEMEYQMIAEDRQEKERVDARNALEEYVYELRGKLGSEDELATFVEEKERSSLSGALDDMESWLYEEGEDCLRQAYIDRLSQLKARGEPIKVRRQESQGRAAALEELSHSLMLARKALGAAETGDERYNHLTTEELQKLHQGVDKTSHWLEEQRALLARTPRTQDPPVLVATIRQEKQSFDSLAGSVLNKPKPKVEPPPAPAKEEAPPSESTTKTENSNGQPTVEMDTD